MEWTDASHPISEPNRKQKKIDKSKASPFPVCFSLRIRPFFSRCSSTLQMETILSPHSLSPIFHQRPSSSSKTLISPSQPQPRSNSVSLTKPINSAIKIHPSQSLKLPHPKLTSWLSRTHHGLAALALSLALNFCPILPSSSALASEFDVLNDGPPKDSYVVDDAGVLSRVTKSDLKRLLSDLESRKNFHINFVTVRKLTVSSYKYKFGGM